MAGVQLGVVDKRVDQGDVCWDALRAVGRVRAAPARNRAVGSLERNDNGGGTHARLLAAAKSCATAHFGLSPVLEQRRARPVETVACSESGRWLCREPGDEWRRCEHWAIDAVLELRRLCGVVRIWNSCF